MNARTFRSARRLASASAVLAVLFGLPGCGTDDGVTTTSVGMSYGAYYGPGYYGPGYYGGYYEPYPPVVVVPPGDGSNRPDRPGGGERPTTLPADVDRPSAKPAMAPSRPSSTSRPTSRPSPRPAPRPMPRGGGMRR